jgi:hypothetical protein
MNIKGRMNSVIKDIYIKKILKKYHIILKTSLNSSNKDVEKDSTKERQILSYILKDKPKVTKEHTVKKVNNKSTSHTTNNSFSKQARFKKDLSTISFINFIKLNEEQLIKYNGNKNIKNSEKEEIDKKTIITLINTFKKNILFKSKSNIIKIMI